MSYDAQDTIGYQDVTLRVLCPCGRPQHYAGIAVAGAENQLAPVSEEEYKRRREENRKR